MSVELAIYLLSVAGVEGAPDPMLGYLPVVILCHDEKRDCVNERRSGPDETIREIESVTISHDHPARMLTCYLH